MQRTSTSGPVHLFSHDFAGQETPEPLARDDRGVDQYAWSPNGAWGIALVEGDPLALNPGNSARDLGDGFDGITFAPNSGTAYAIRATLAGSNDRAELLGIDMASGSVQSLAIWAYPHPVTFQQGAVQEAQFADEGGFNRVYVLDDGRVVVWILGAPPVYTYDPATGAAGTTERAPILWSPNGQLRVEVTESGGNSTITVRGLANETRAAAGVAGYVSHVRWSSLNNQIVFTLTQATSDGGVSQDLYLWDVRTGSNAVRLTQDLRSMGGMFRGVQERWKP
jgi:WD40 repeat protein